MENKVKNCSFVLNGRNGGEFMLFFRKIIKFDGIWRQKIDDFKG